MGTRGCRVRYRWVIGVVLLLGACTRSTPEPATPQPSPLKLEWAYRNETHWLLATEVRSIAALAGLAGGRAAQDLRVEPAAGAYQAVSAAGTWTVRPEPHVWSPAALEPVAAGLLAGVEARAANDAGADAEVMSALSDLRASVLQAWNERLSDALQRSPQDPALHERAAFLLGAFAFREPAGWYSDTRVEVSRMTAHLAVARALRRGESAGRSGRLAEAMIAALAGRQLEAVQIVDALQPPDSAGERAWKRAIRIRATGDWRLLPAAEGSLVERFEKLRAMVDRLGPDAGGAYLDEQREEVPDWGRHSLRGSPRSVTEGNRFIPSQLGSEMVEIAEVLGPPDDAAGSLARLLSTEPVPGGVATTQTGQTLRILDRGLWSAFFERRLGEFAGTAVHFQRKVLALPEQAVHTTQAMDQLLRGLPLYVFARRRVSVKQSDDDALRPQAELVFGRHPERITTGNWWSGREKPGYGQGIVGLPPSSAWFTPAPPPGTGYVGVMQRHEVLLAKSRQELEKIWEIAPYDVSLARELVNRSGKPAPVAAILRYRKDLDYDREALEALAKAKQDDPAAYTAVYEKLCAIDPEAWVDLAVYLRERGDTAATLRAHEKMVALTRDQVAVSQEVGWLVNYYYDNGRAQQAFRLAREAAQVYSYDGLRTYAELCEKDKRYDAAEEHFRRIAERYEDRVPLLYYYRRQEGRLGKKLVAQRLEGLIREVMPQGLEKVKLSDFQGPPRDGAVMKSSSEKLTAAGLDKGAVVVAVDGNRVRTFEAYLLAIELAQNPRHQFIAWRGGRYVEVAADLPDGRFGVQMNTYAR